MLGAILLYILIMIILAILLFLVVLLTKPLEEMISLLCSVVDASFSIFMSMDSSSDKDGEDDGWSFQTKFLIWCAWTCFVLGLALYEALLNQLALEELKIYRAYFYQVFAHCAPHVQFILVCWREGYQIWKLPDLGLLQHYFKPRILSPHETNDITADVLLFLCHVHGYRNKDLEERLNKPLKSKGLDVVKIKSIDDIRVDLLVKEHLAKNNKK
jgi:hypothetical protein